MGNNRIVKIQIGHERRTVCISDIHGNLQLLKKLLRRLRLCSEDNLVLLGDYIERGKENAATVEFLMRLAERPKTYMLRGNLDTICEYFLYRANIDEALHYCNKRWNNLISELAARDGIHKLTEENFPRVREIICGKYGHMLEFFSKMPVAFESDMHVFTHSGVDTGENWREAQEDRFVRNYDFYKDRRNPTGKCVVFGHMPTFNMPESGPSDLPVILPDEGYAAIDGGNNVKETGQLNALIIETYGGKTQYSVCFACSNSIREVKYDYTADPSIPFVKTPWPEEELTVVRRGEFFSDCLVGYEKKPGRIKNEHHCVRNGKTVFIYNTVSCGLSVQRGEKVYVLDDRCAGYLLVKNFRGIMGWVPSDILT